MSKNPKFQVLNQSSSRLLRLIQGFCMTGLEGYLYTLKYISRHSSMQQQLKLEAML